MVHRAVTRRGLTVSLFGTDCAAVGGSGARALCKKAEGR
jgi:hypothetical protein